MVPEIWRLRSYGAPVRWISISTGTTGQARGKSDQHRPLLGSTYPAMLILLV